MVYTTMRGRRSDSEEDENLLGSNLGKQKDIPETEYRQLGLQDNTDVVGLAISQLSHLLSQSRQNFHVDDDDGVPGSTAGSNNFQVQRWVDSLSDAYLSPNMHPHMLRAPATSSTEENTESEGMDLSYFTSVNPSSTKTREAITTKTEYFKIAPAG